MTKCPFPVDAKEVDYEVIPMLVSKHTLSLAKDFPIPQEPAHPFRVYRKPELKWNLLDCRAVISMMKLSLSLELRF